MYRQRHRQGASNMANRNGQRISNWRDYNRALINRGNLTLWIDDKAIATWHTQQKKATEDVISVIQNWQLNVRSLFAAC